MRVHPLMSLPNQRLRPCLRPSQPRTLWLPCRPRLCHRPRPRRHPWPCNPPVPRRCRFPPRPPNHCPCQSQRLTKLRHQRRWLFPRRLLRPGILQSCNRQTLWLPRARIPQLNPRLRTLLPAGLGLSAVQWASWWRDLSSGWSHAPGGPPAASLPVPCKTTPVSHPENDCVTFPRRCGKFRPP